MVQTPDTITLLPRPAHLVYSIVAYRAENLISVGISGRYAHHSRMVDVVRQSSYSLHWYWSCHSSLSLEGHLSHSTYTKDTEHSYTEDQIVQMHHSQEGRQNMDKTPDTITLLPRPAHLVVVEYTYRAENLILEQYSREECHCTCRCVLRQSCTEVSLDVLRQDSLVPFYGGTNRPVIEPTEL